ncbi:Uncharacterized protein DAT39_002406, partial [Clarias magur]
RHNDCTDQLAYLHCNIRPSFEDFTAQIIGSLPEDISQLSAPPEGVLTCEIKRDS